MRGTLPYMQNLFVSFFDIVFPPRKDELRVRALTKEDMRLFFAIRSIEGITVLSSYAHRDIRTLIHEAKFHNNARASMLLGVLLNQFLCEKEGTFDSIVPIPLSRARLRARGYNQVEEILLTIPEIHTHIHTDTIRRTRNTTPQTELKRTDRLLNMRDAFTVVDPIHVRGKRILIIDDVVTTGATIRAAKASLLPHSPTSVTCLALTH